MPLKKISITLDDESLARLAVRTHDDGARSEMIQRIVSRYEELTRRDLPKLSVGEWRLCADALNGTWLRESWSIAGVWLEIADGIKMNMLDEKFEVDGPALIEKLGKFTFGQTVALVDTVERYWAAVSRGEGPMLPGEAAPPKRARG